MPAHVHDLGDVLDEHRTLIHACTARGAGPEGLLEDGASHGRALAVGGPRRGNLLGREPRRLEMARKIVDRAGVMIATRPHHSAVGAWGRDVSVVLGGRVAAR